MNWEPTIDLTAGRTVKPVVGINGKPVSVLGWQFLPGSGTLLALTFDRSLLLVDPVAGTVSPLGQFLTLAQISPGSCSTQPGCGKCCGSSA